MKILIAIPCMDTVPVPFAESLLNLNKPEGTKVCFKAGSLIYDARNLLSLTAIDNQFDYVLWLDSDMTFPHDTLTRLLKGISITGAEMMSGLYVKRTMPTAPVIYKSIQPPEPDENGILRIHINEYRDYQKNKDNVFPVAGCGFGCVLTSVKLLKEVWDEYGPAFAPYPWAGEDISFCYRVNQLYAKQDNPLELKTLTPIMCDRDISCGHVGSFLYTEDILKRGEAHD